MRANALPFRPTRALAQAIRATMLCVPLAAVTASPDVLAQSSPSEQTLRSYDIPAGPLSSSLSRFAGEAGVLLSVEGSLVQGLQSSGLEGQYSVDEGFDALLQGSGMQAVRDSQNTYSLAPSARQADAVELKPMVVQGFALGNALGSTEGYNATHSSVATKTSMPLLETSQTVSVVTRQQMEDQGAQSVAQALRYTPGVMSSPYGHTGRYDYVAMRGIVDGSVDNLFLDGLKLMGDSGTNSSLQVDSFFIERADVLKGPTSVLYGRSQPGGLVSLTTKKPLYTTSRRIELSYGSHDTRQAAFDLTGPLSDRVAYRLVGVSRNGENQIDYIDRERYALMPSLSVDLSEDTRLTLMAILQHDPSSGYHGGMPALGSVTSFNGRRISRSFYEGEEDEEKSERDQQMFGYQFEHRFNDAVSARQNFRYVDSDIKVGQVYQFGYVNDAGDLNRIYTSADESLHAWSIDNQLQFEFATGPMDHVLVTGLDYQRRRTKVDYDGGTVSPVNPYSGSQGDYSFTSRYSVYEESRELEQTGLYVQDLISLNNWRFSVGMRQDWVDTAFGQDNGQQDSLKDEKLTGRLGVLYAFDNGFSPFISYSESFNPNTASANANPGSSELSLLDPTEGEQYEVGVKFQPPGSDALYTLSYFDLKQSNLVTKDSNEYFFRSAGEISSKGVEFEARFSPVRNLSVLGSYTYLDVEYSKDHISSAGTNNRGNTPNAVARNMASLWADYSFHAGPLTGLQIGGGARYFGKSWADAENTLRVPSYTVYDALLRYDLSEVGLEGVGVRLNLNNLTDEKYVAACNSLNQCYFGDERNVMATVTYDF